MKGATPLSSDASGMPNSDRPNDATEASLTRVMLAYVEQRINLYLRFGHPVRELRIDRWRRCAFFAPATMFCRVHWESNEYGTTRWQLLVLRTCRPLDGMQRIMGVQPGARLLLRAEGGRQAAPVLQRIDAIEALGLDPAAVSPAYWRTLHNRLIARMPLPAYTAERHTAYLAGGVLR
jgi:hypothetical protein